MRTVRSTSCAGTVLCVRINVRSELENEVRSEDHGHAREESSSGGLACKFGLAACDDGGSGFVNASVRTITNARQVGLRLQSKCNSTHRHARVDAEDVIGKREQTGTWVREAARARDEQLKKGQAGNGDAGAEEESRGCKQDVQHYQ